MSNQTLNMKPNVAAALSYVFGWISGLIIFFLEKQDRYVRIHAMQSILVSAIFTVLTAVIRFVLGWFFLGKLILGVLSFAFFLVWLICIVQAASYKDFRIPFIGAIAEGIVG
ncbi:DUF4870 domain-containing protein [Zongyangia hominis]|uniref:DUF4870 domain-containing protein n=1 Tax=Zongyangia hominis TaxID=2763677 RepID=A0A926IBP5_9FIRM|nr:DUF4870 domain-containing protein [Zongyangia hominis]MBC8570498.1 hypothetical protein [Zongyangia hominis]